MKLRFVGNKKGGKHDGGDKGESAPKKGRGIKRRKLPVVVRRKTKILRLPTAVINSSTKKRRGGGKVSGRGRKDLS